MGKNRRRNKSNSGNRDSSMPNYFQSRDMPPPSNALYPDPKPLRSLMDLPSVYPDQIQTRGLPDHPNRDEHFGTVNKPPWQKNKEERNDARSWNREREVSGLNNNMAQGAFINRSCEEDMERARRMMDQAEFNRQRGEDVSFRNRPQNWNEPDVNQFRDSSGPRRDDGPRESQRSNWNSGPERPSTSNWNDGQTGGPQMNFNDRSRASFTDWDDGPREPSRSNWDSGPNENPGLRRDDGPRRPSESNWNDSVKGPSMSKWEDGPRGSNGPDGPRRSPNQDGNQRGPYWADRQRGSVGPNWDDRSGGPSRPYMEDESRRQGPAWDERPRESPRANWNAGANSNEGMSEPRKPNWDDGPRANRGSNREDGSRTNLGSNWDDRPRELGIQQDFAMRDVQNNWDSQMRESEGTWINQPGGNSLRNRQAAPEDPGWMDRLESSEVRSWKSQMWEGQNPINRPGEFVENLPRMKRALTPERDVWSRLESGDCRNVERIKRIKTSCDRDRAMAINISKDVPVASMDSKQIEGSGVDLREKLTRRGIAMKPVVQHSRKVLICPRFHRLKFSPKIFEEIKDRLIKKLYELAKSDDYENQPQLRFKDMKLESRRLIIVECQDKITTDWLLGWYPLGLRVRVRIVIPEDLRVFTTVVFFVKGQSREDPDSVKNTLRVQNPGLEVASWQDGQTKMTKKGQAYYYIVGGETLRYLESNGWELFWEMQKIFIRRIKSHNVKPLCPDM